MVSYHMSFSRVLALTACTVALAMESFVPAQDKVQPVDFTNSSVLFDVAGNPVAVTFAGSGGRERGVGVLGVDRVAATTGAGAHSWPIGHLAVGGRGDRAVALSETTWLLVSMYTPGGGRSLALREVELRRGEPRSGAQAALEVLLPHAGSAGLRDLVNAIPIAYEAGSGKARLLVECGGLMAVTDRRQGPAITVSGGLWECAVQLGADSSVTADDTKGTRPASAAYVGAGTGAQLVSIGSAVMVAARLGEPGPDARWRSGRLCLYRRVEAASTWEPVELPEHRIGGCWAAVRAANGDLLVTDVQRGTPGELLLRKGLLAQGAADWVVSTSALRGVVVEPERVSWQVAPNRHPMPWTVDKDGRALALAQ